MSNSNFDSAITILKLESDYKTVCEENTSLGIINTNLKQVNQAVITNLHKLKAENKTLSERVEHIDKLEARITVFYYENQELKNEIKDLKKENQDLKREIHNLKHENNVLKSDNNDLRRENAELRRENAELRRENAELRRENAELRREIAKLKHENAELRRENAGLKYELDELRNAIMYNKFIIAIQDVNNSYLLESKLNKYSDTLETIRDNRNNTAHYIVRKRNDMDERMFSLKNYILNLNDGIREKFIEEYDDEGLLDALVEFIDNQPLNIDETKLKKITYWTKL